VQKISRRQFLASCFVGVFGTGLFEFSYSQKIRITRRTLRLSGWRANGFKIAFLSDFHICNPRSFQRGIQAFQMALQEKPDIVALGGDLIDSVVEQDLSYFKRTLSEMDSSPIPVVAVTGNHEYAHFKPSDIFNLFKKSHVQLLQNEILHFQDVSIIGIDDPCSGQDRYDFIQTSRLSNSSIALVHTPDTVDRLPPFVKLQLSGHSHGGQICLPFGIPIKTRPLAEKYTGGYYSKAPIPLYVSRGVGTSGIDLRLFCPPEITILTLQGTPS